MKKKLSMMLLAFVVAVTSFTAIDLVNNKAEAKDWVKKGQIWSTHYHSGSFKNYTYSPTFHIYYPGQGTWANITEQTDQAAGKLQQLCNKRQIKAGKMLKLFMQRKKALQI